MPRKAAILILAALIGLCGCQDTDIPDSSNAPVDAGRREGIISLHPIWTDSTINIGKVEAGALHNQILQAFDRIYDFSSGHPIDASTAIVMIQRAINDAAPEYGYREMIRD